MEKPRRETLRVASRPGDSVHVTDVFSTDLPSYNVASVLTRFHR